MDSFMISTENYLENFQRSIKIENKHRKYIIRRISEQYLFKEFEALYSLDVPPFFHNHEYNLVKLESKAFSILL